MAENEKRGLSEVLEELEAVSERLALEEEKSAGLSREIAEMKAEIEKVRPDPVGEANQTNLRVLLIDGVLMFRHNLRLLLEASGFEVVGEVGTSDEAAIMESLLLTNPDIVTIDYYMYGLERTRVISKIRSSLPDAKIVIISAELSPSELQSSLEAGAHDFVTKPIQKEQLVSVLERLLSLKRVRAG